MAIAEDNDYDYDRPVNPYDRLCDRSPWLVRAYHSTLAYTFMAVMLVIWITLALLPLDKEMVGRGRVARWCNWATIKVADALVWVAQRLQRFAGEGGGLGDWYDRGQAQPG
jgi:hypothetical protein